MTPTKRLLSGLPILLVLITALGAAPVWASRSDGPEDGKGGRHHKHDDRSDDKRGRHGGHDDRGGERRPASPPSGPVVNIQIGAYFGDSQRQVARDYYGPQFRSGHCPPGLAKKNNGCMPPGQAKKWRVGSRLPSGVVYYPVPTEVVVRLGTPPVGYKYVRVAADILMIAIGTSMVVDAIEDLSRL